jgi:hypothetical protein
MGPVIPSAAIGLILLVLALSGSKLAQRAVIMIVGLMGVTLLAIWFLLRPV